MSDLAAKWDAWARRAHVIPWPWDNADPPAGAKDGRRTAQFGKLDTNVDGKLSQEEFSVGRVPAEAEKWFAERDADSDGLISRDEFLSGTPIPEKAAKLNTVACLHGIRLRRHYRHEQKGNPLVIRLICDGMGQDRPC